MSKIIKYKKMILCIIMLLFVFGVIIAFFMFAPYNYYWQGTYRNQFIVDAEDENYYIKIMPSVVFTEVEDSYLIEFKLKETAPIPKTTEPSGLSIGATTYEQVKILKKEMDKSVIVGFRYEGNTDGPFLIYAEFEYGDEEYIKLRYSEKKDDLSQQEFLNLVRVQEE